MSEFTDSTDTTLLNSSGHLADNIGDGLIAASKVEGTSIYNRQGESLGSIHEVMLDKTKGNVAYAVMSFGGFLGMGKKYHPLPWSMLSYDQRLGGYVVNLDKDRLEGAPAYDDDTEANWADPAYGRGIDDYYGRPMGPLV
ncbi:PRC-barrel domain-containing protein [Arboricoccus pini]|uniref:PRC-barrel domain-containing protein n=1 Tax=Arboricoccus pini TaxID=1963835 RepID=A0A212RPD6_9PROT|nr:PRC-barrel domain-containing protein [Arboricoccus pini]SNB74296.1 PRC-barrel domain-containing protein [Arboricoccus pini]